MKVWASSIYRCPISGEPLHLLPFEEEDVALSQEDQGRLEALGFTVNDFSRQINSGVLLSESAGYWYPIDRGVPILLDFNNALIDRFEAENAQHHHAWRGRRRPDAKPRPGELLTQKSFTAEWASIDEGDELTFTYNHEERCDFIRLELCWPRTAPPANGFKTLDIGCGSGLESMFLAQVTERMVFGIDLNTSILRVAARLKACPLAHNGIASVFAPPFAPESFDLVYSHGVLHHTYNTERAFASARRFAAPHADIYIWVYALEDAQRGKLAKKLGYLAELFLRPKIARLPEPLQSIFVKLLALQHFRKYRRKGLKKDVWRFRHSEHSMRDRWTCLFAHRHSFHEIIGWFLSAGYTCRLIDPLEYRRCFKRNLIGIGVLGTKIDCTPRETAVAICYHADLPST